MQNADKQERYITELSTFAPGMRVRVWVGADPSKTMKQLKDYAHSHSFGRRWTREVYTIKAVGGSDAGWRILLEGSRRRFSPRDVLKLSESEASEAGDAETAAAAAAGKAEARGEAETARKRRRVANLLSRTGLHEAGRELLEPEDGPLEGAFIQGQTVRPGLRQTTLRDRSTLRKRVKLDV